MMTKGSYCKVGEVKAEERIVEAGEKGARQCPRGAPWGKWVCQLREEMRELEEWDDGTTIRQRQKISRKGSKAENCRNKPCVVDPDLYQDHCGRILTCSHDPHPRSHAEYSTARRRRPISSSLERGSAFPNFLLNFKGERTRKSN
jgi:hypothetical protein